MGCLMWGTHSAGEANGAALVRQTEPRWCEN